MGYDVHSILNDGILVHPGDGLDIDRLTKIFFKAVKMRCCFALKPLIIRACDLELRMHLFPEDYPLTLVGCMKQLVHLSECRFTDAAERMRVAYALRHNQVLLIMRGMEKEAPYM
eukprot:scaffold335745_cov14-Prasinocladus_malaysianus.AAC.1